MVDLLRLMIVLLCGLFVVGACSDDDGTAKDTSQGGSDTTTPTDTTSGDTTNPSDGTVQDIGLTDMGRVDTVADITSGTDLGNMDSGGTDATDKDAGTPVTCGTDSPEAFAACVETQPMMSDLAVIEGARSAKSKKSTDVRTFLESRLKELGYTVETHDYGAGANVVATLPGLVEPDETVIISAHYDSVPLCSGADDNGSGVVGALEAARVLASGSHDRTLQIAFWDEEERGILGSAAWVALQVNAGRRFVVSFVLEMIGYYSDVPNSQTFPQGFGFLFPAAEQAMVDNDWRGDFIAVLAGDDTLNWVSAMEQYAGQNDHRIVSVILNESLRESPFLGDLRRSDHAPFWQAHYPAINLTDTANFRNPYYHCAAGDDVAKWIGEAKMAKTVAATVYGAVLALQKDNPKGVTPQTPACDVVKQDCAGGQKCALILTGNAWYKPQCVAPHPEVVGLGELCVRPENVVGDDTCAGGMFCTFWGGLGKKDPAERWCVSHCHEDTDCGVDEVCVTAGSTGRGNGVCLKRCDPWGTACPNETNCTAERRGIDHKLRFGCFFAGAIGEGGTCGIAFDDCAVGLSCAFHPESGVSRCRKPCDDTHPCDGGQQCLAAANPPPDMPSLGFCWDD